MGRLRENRGDQSVKSSARVLANIGKIRYTNCVPFYHRLNGSAEFEFLETHPAEVNRALNEGKVEIAPVSSLEYLRNQNKYYLLPGLSITARNFSGSVLLFSSVKLEDLNGVKIALSEESLSSAMLLRILLKLKFRFENSFETVPSAPEKMLSEHKAALVIGDDALFYQPKEFVYKYDLGELWWKWTGKPFCFAVWAVRREFADRHPAEVSEFCNLLVRNLDRNLQDLEALLKDSLGLTFMDKKYSKTFGYLFNLHYGMDAEVLEGLELFYKYAHQQGLAPEPAPFEFFKI